MKLITKKIYSDIKRRSRERINFKLINRKENMSTEQTNHGDMEYPFRLGSSFREVWNKVIIQVRMNIVFSISSKINIR